MIYAFDLEIFPNFFSGIFINVETKQELIFIISEQQNDLPKLEKFLTLRPTLIGYNSYSFDIPLLSYLVTVRDLSKAYLFAQAIIENKVDNEYYRHRDSNIKSIDIQKVLGLDSMISLKQAAIALQWPMIQDLPLSPLESITVGQIEDIIDYNRNDVLITLELYKVSLGEIRLREEVSELFGLDLVNLSDSQMANEILNKLYAQELGVPLESFQDLRTKRDSITIKDCIGKGISFQSDTLRKLLKSLQSETIERMANGNYDFRKRTINFRGRQYEMGVGGLHSHDDPGIFQTDDEYIIIDADVASFYPNIILINRLKPAHLDDKFLEIYSRLTKERLRIKEEGQLLKATALKIVINSIFGKLGSETFWLYDPLQFYSVTISGQLYLLMLIEMLEESGIEVISANTDGVVAKVRKNDGITNRLSTYKHVTQVWEEKTGFTLEYTRYKLYVRRDVNAYLAVSEEGKIKTKGIFDDITTTKNLSRYIYRSYRMPIVIKAITDYFLEGVPIEKTIRECDNIYWFVSSQKASKQFDIILRNGREHNICQRTNRYYMPVSGGMFLEKKDKTGKIISMADHTVCLANDLRDCQSIDHYNIDYDYYIKQAEKTLFLIKPPVAKGSLF